MIAHSHKHTQTRKKQGKRKICRQTNTMERKIFVVFMARFTIEDTHHDLQETLKHSWKLLKMETDDSGSFLQCSGQESERST